ncbi:MAG: YegP family protein [Flavobacteriales bacterium]
MFELFQSEKSGEFYFRLKAKNGQIILSSQGYTTKAACQNGIDSVKTNSQNKDRFDKKEVKGNKFRFNLKSSNGQIVGSSQNYESEAGCDNGIQSVITNAKDAEVKDLTI